MALDNEYGYETGVIVKEGVAYVIGENCPWCDELECVCGKGITKEDLCLEEAGETEQEIGQKRKRVQDILEKSKVSDGKIKVYGEEIEVKKIDVLYNGIRCNGIVLREDGKTIHKIYCEVNKSRYVVSLRNYSSLNYDESGFVDNRLISGIFKKGRQIYIRDRKRYIDILNFSKKVIKELKKEEEGLAK